MVSNDFWFFIEMSICFAFIGTLMTVIIKMALAEAASKANKDPLEVPRLVKGILVAALRYQQRNPDEFKRYAVSISQRKKIVKDGNGQPYHSDWYELFLTDFVIQVGVEAFSVKNEYDRPYEPETDMLTPAPPLYPRALYRQVVRDFVKIFAFDGTTRKAVNIDEYCHETRAQLLQACSEQLQLLREAVRADETKAEQERIERRRLAEVEQQRQTQQHLLDRDRLAQDIIRRHQHPPGE